MICRAIWWQGWRCCKRCEVVCMGLMQGVQLCMAHEDWHFKLSWEWVRSSKAKRRAESTSSFTLIDNIVGQQVLRPYILLLVTSNRAVSKTKRWGFTMQDDKNQLKSLSTIRFNPFVAFLFMWYAESQLFQNMYQHMYRCMCVCIQAEFQPKPTCWLVRLFSTLAVFCPFLLRIVPEMVAKSSDAAGLWHKKEDYMRRRARLLGSSSANEMQVRKQAVMEVVEVLK